MPFNPGENIGPYRIVEQLGQGGMATVYKAYHAALDRFVALKVLHPAFGEDPHFEARFTREARLVAKLEHPNIIPIYDYSEHDKRPFLVMKYIEGETLKARMSKGPLGTVELTKILEAIGSALSYAHKMGILHRDIKPSNVLLTTDGSIYLADFGLARIASMGESTLSGDMIMGTPQYISPEQAMGKKDLDEGTDIYSFGVMLYEMVVGQVPFNADTPFSIIHDHIYTPLPIPHKINPGVPESVERVLLKTLSKERGDRYATVDEMVTAFKQAWLSAGVPMKGTTITIEQHVAAAAEKPAPAMESKENRAVADTQSAPEIAKTRKKTPRWLVISGAVLIFLCCIFGLFVLRRASLESRQALGEIGTELSQLTPEFNFTPPVELIPTTGMVENPDATPTPLLPAIRDAMLTVTSSPTDPFALLHLSLAYWEAGQPHWAYEEMSKAAELAGQNTDFFLEAGRQFIERDAWLAAAVMFQRAILTLKGEEIPPDLMNAYHAAVYLSASNDQSAIYLPFDKIAKVDQGLAYVAEARHLLYNGEITKAQEFLERARRTNPNMPEVTLLDAEFAFKEGNPQEARALLSQLLIPPDMPEWIRTLAATYLAENPK